MTGYLTIEADDARAVCARLEFDASWDKAGPGYYELNKQIKASLSVGVGSLVAYSYESILVAMGTRLIDEDEEGPASDCTTAIERRNTLLAELVTALKNADTLARLIASNPGLITGRVQRPPVDWDVEAILKEKVVSAVKEALNAVIASHLLRANKNGRPAAEYAKCVEELIENWQRKHKKDRGSLIYDFSERLKGQLQILVKGKHTAFIRGEIWNFVSREIRDKADLRRFFVAAEVLELEDAFSKSRKVSQKAKKASVKSGA
jgi:hypothetical protein